MIVHDLDVFRAGVGPTEAHSKLIVYADTVLTCTFASQRFQPIAGWYPQVVEPARNIQLAQLAPRHGRNVREPFDHRTARNSLRVGALERLDHEPDNNAVRD
jgi:hypothetical protein